MPFTFIVNPAAARASESCRMVAGRLRFFCVTALLSLALVSCGGDDATAGSDPFVDITAATGIRFMHEVRLNGNFPLPEITAPGCAAFDANGDGRLDLYFTNAGECGGAGAPNQLWCQREDGTFADETASSGLGDSGYGMGVAVGDIDNDGDLDVYVGNDGADALYLNDGSGKFTDVSVGAGVTGEVWTTSVSFLDFDADGWLDIYVVHYVEDGWTRLCTNERGQREYCDPRSLRGVADTLYRNAGDGTFDDQSEASGIAAVAKNGLGVVVDDFDDDGWPDVFVANDGQANHLWLNQRDGTFREDALMQGVAVNAHGASEASMGVAAGDVDNDGDADLFMTHLMRESNTLYLREEFGFTDRSVRTGLAGPSLAMTGFGTVMFDIEHDGDLDVAVANGRVERGPVYEGAAIDELWNRYAEPNQLFRNAGGGQYDDVSAHSPAFCGSIQVSRGLLVADLDSDGDLDLIVANCRGPAKIFANVAEKSGHWLKVRAVDDDLRRAVYGAVVIVHAGGHRYRRTVAPQQSYLSSGSIEMHFGLGAEGAFERIDVRWPGGQTERFPGGGADRAITLRRGEGVR